ncbi:MAG: phosphonoacetate hydrolase [Acidobacteria bacterium 13_1_40CM_65_14]|nr:MAG: phosphonoacetate hydrolase [Acidobacteria bacterium 13_1_40CM_65_14]
MIVNGRTYRRPTGPVVVVCLDGSAFEYIERAIAAGVAPYLQSLVRSKFFRLVSSALPSFTNPNNVSIVTGVPPAAHGISGNFFLDRETGEAVMMNDASFLRADTILSAFSKAGARVVVVTAKDKLRRLLGHGVDTSRGLCMSTEAGGIAVYSAALSEETLAEGVRQLQSAPPDLMYLSTSDYVQHKYEPGDESANRFYAAVDRSLASIDATGATLVVTADHGMRAKADETGVPRAIYLQDVIDGWLGAGVARVILPITDPYVLHHGSLGSCAMVYLTSSIDAAAVAERIAGLKGIDLAVSHDQACAQFELPADRTGDIVVFSNGETVVGTRPGDHDLSALDAPLRSHGGRSEQLVPMLANRVIDMPASRCLRNFDAFDIALNHCP